MARSETHEAIVLRTYDIGEADLLCILLTKEKGRLVASAKGARRIQSHFLGKILPFTHIEVDLCDWKERSIIVGARVLSFPRMRSNLRAFYARSQAVELLLALTEDGEPLPSIFSLTKEFVVEESGTETLPAFTFRLLHLLGLLPEETAEELGALNSTERTFLRATKEGKRLRDIPPTPYPSQGLMNLRTMLIAGHLSGPLRTECAAPFSNFQ